MRAPWLLTLVAACDGAATLVVPPGVRTALAVIDEVEEVRVWTQEDQDLEADASGVELLLYDEPLEHLELARDGSLNLVRSTAPDGVPLPRARRGLRLGPEDEAPVAVSAMSERAQAIRVPPPACPDFPSGSVTELEVEAFGAQRASSLVGRDEIALITTKSEFPPFSPPRALFVEGTRVRELTLSATTSGDGTLTALDDTDGLLLVYSDAALFAVFRVSTTGAVRELHRISSPPHTTSSHAHWPGSEGVYGVEDPTLSLVRFDLGTGAFTAQSGVGLDTPTCSTPGRVFLRGPEEGLVALNGNLPMRFAPGDARLERYVTGEQPSKACEVMAVELSTGAELVSYRGEFFSGEKGKSSMVWRPTPADEWSTVEVESHLDDTVTLGDATFSRLQVGDGLARLRHSPGRPELPPRVCPPSSFDKVRYLSASGGAGLALSEERVGGATLRARILRFRP